VKNQAAATFSLVYILEYLHKLHGLQWKRNVEETYLNHARCTEKKVERGERAALVVVGLKPQELHRSSSAGRRSRSRKKRSKPPLRTSAVLSLSHHYQYEHSATGKQEATSDKQAALASSYSSLLRSPPAAAGGSAAEQPRVFRSWELPLPVSCRRDLPSRNREGSGSFLGFLAPRAAKAAHSRRRRRLLLETAASASLRQSWASWIERLGNF
jgi:hypothetical protein